MRQQVTIMSMEHLNEKLLFYLLFITYLISEILILLSTQSPITLSISLTFPISSSISARLSSTIRERTL